MSEEFHFFWSGPFSQWYKADFKVNDILYNCAEQYMMTEKARLFKDFDTEKLIMSTKNPKEQKRLGRLVKNFDPIIWEANALPIVYRGNFHKHIQNTILLQTLYNTYPKTLVEASPYDKIWGIGLSEDDPRAHNRNTWEGLNWLGETLTVLCDHLLTGKVEYKWLS